MAEPITYVRLLTYAALAVSSGAALFAVLCVQDHRHWRTQAFGYAAVAMLAMAQLFLIAAQGGGATPGDILRASLTLATTAWTGELLSLRAIVAVATAALVAASKSSNPRLALGLAILNLVLLPLSGHAASASPFTLSIVFHALHVASAILWLGGLLWLAAALFSRRQPSPREAFRAQLSVFSPVALGLVVVAACSGVLAAILQVGRPAALFGTPYGHFVLLKAFILLPLALASAAWLRFRVLRRESNGPTFPALVVEIGGVAALCVVAALLSQGVPGRHDDIAWPFDFRLDLLRLWTDPRHPTTMTWLFAIAAFPLVLALYLAFKRAWLRAGICLLAVIAIPLFGLPQAAVPATPMSFATSTSRYAAPNLTNAAGLFQKQCAYCHGETGRGDGPVIAELDFANSDLTAPHTKDHPDGDLFWWISHGTPSGQMPDFEQEIDDDGRWDLVNYVRFLTNSRESAKLGPEVEPYKPWLPAIDFDFLDSNGNARSLRDVAPNSAVLLVIGRDPASLSRLAELRRDVGVLKVSAVAVIFVCGPEIAGSCKDDTSDPSLIVLQSNVDDLVWAWTGYRRTRLHPDDADTETTVGDMEFLIDRFGYVRAKWRADEGPLEPLKEIGQKAAALRSEPELVAPTMQHSH